MADGSERTERAAEDSAGAENGNRPEEELQVHTDLALEARESVLGEAEGIPGIRIEEAFHQKSGVKVTKVEITDERGEEAIGKPMGIYITLEAEQMAAPDEGSHREISEELSFYIKELLESFGDPRAILAVGLGNHEVTSDSLGPRVLDNLKITRHLYESRREKGILISGIIPGVMAQTGMETAEIVRGIVRETKPDAVEGMRMEERYQMVRELIEPRFGPMFVTPGNIDEKIKLLSYTISEGINLAFCPRE